MTEQRDAGPGPIFAFGEQSEGTPAVQPELTELAYRAGRYDRRKAIVNGKPISKRQSAYYCFIHRYMAEHEGEAPLLSEIGAAMGVTAVAAHHVVEKLERHGWLEVRPNTPRGIALVRNSGPDGSLTEAPGQ